MKQRCFTGWLALLLMILSGSAFAHDLGLTRIVVQPNDQGVLLEATLPVKLEVSSPIPPDGCLISDHDSQITSRISKVESWLFRCDTAALEDDSVIQLRWTREGALISYRVNENNESSLFTTPSDGFINIALNTIIHPEQSSIEVATRYFGLGVEHILSGIDHLAFVLILCLIASGKRLIWLITGFTLGHSVTLAMASLGWISVPMPPVEACIALSIAFMARIAFIQFRSPASDESSAKHGFGLVAAFGLLHGLGFASALQEIGLASEDLLLGLLSFNLGVEAGQLIFVSAFLILMRAIQLLSVQRHWQQGAVAFGIGSLSIFWFMERVAQF